MEFFEEEITGIRLKELRTERDLTMDMVVNEINRINNVSITRGNLSRWENGINVPSLFNLKLLAKFFGVSTDYLAGLTDIRTPVNLLAKRRKGIKKE